MSWKLFKVNMLLYMNNPIGVVTPVQFATKLATEYDSCMRRGGQLIGKEAVMAGNLPLMLSLMGVAQAKAITKTQPSKHDFLSDVGKAVEGYWTGATLMPFPIYPIPAPGSIQNLVLNSGRFNFIYNIYQSKGKYIALCEGDDFWIDENKLQTQVSFLEENSNYSMSFHSVEVANEIEWVIQSGGVMPVQIRNAYDKLKAFYEKQVENEAYADQTVFRKPLRNDLFGLELWQ